MNAADAALRPLKGDFVVDVAKLMFCSDRLRLLRDHIGRHLDRHTVVLPPASAYCDIIMSMDEH